MAKLRNGAGRVLIVGWGFLGAAAATGLLAGGIQVVGLTRSETWRTRLARAQGVSVLVGDARDPAIATGAMQGVDHVLYSAGGLLPPLAAEAPLEDAIATLSPLITILEALRRHPSAGLTYVSSGGTVYGNPARIPVRETDPTRPISPYGVSHLAGEMYAQMYARTHGFTLNIVRCANVYGPGQAHHQSQGAVAVFFDRLAAGLPVVIIGDGSALRDYVFIDDVAGAIVRIIAERLAVDIVNLGSGRGHTVIELIEYVSRVVERPAVLDFQPHRKHDVDAIVLDISRIRSFTDYEPTGLERGLEITWRAEQADLREGAGSVTTERI